MRRPFSLNRNRSHQLRGWYCGKGEHDRFGGVRHRRQVVAREHRERLRDRQALLGLLVGGERATEQEAAATRGQPADGCVGSIAAGRAVTVPGPA
jgi:hypothetical protein